MKKHLSKIILSAIVLAIFMAPISAGIKISKALAQTDPLGTCKFTKNTGITETPPSDQKTIEKLCESPKPASFTAKWDKDPTTPATTGTPATSTPNYELSCSFFNGQTGIIGCGASIFYMFWVVSSWIAKLGGYFLDFFVYYSTNSSSYSNPFVEKGWGVIRDVANIFFIITLLYIAIKMILSLDEHGNKKLIGSVIMIALVINFSLFTTKVVIDSSNILAKIFYNSIEPTQTKTKNSDGTTTTTVEKNGANGERSISIGLVKQFNPQEIIRSETQYLSNQGQFIFVTILSFFITLYTAYIFFSVALLFVSRVVSLWLSMVFAPMAFISYAVPFDLPFGHKEWWDDLLKNAFLAPIFIFFLYIIIMFSNNLKETIGYNGSSTDLVQNLMGTVIPFAILMMLLGKSKKLAEKWSGKMGEAVMTAGKVAMAGIGGGALLGTALAGRATLKTAAKYVQNDSARSKALTFADMRSTWSKGNKLNPFTYTSTAAKAVKGLVNIAPAAAATLANKTRLGDYVRSQDTSFGKKQTAVHELDAKAAAKFGGKGGYDKEVKYSDLKEPDQETAREEADKDTISKEAYGKKFESLTDVSEIETIKAAMLTRSAPDLDTGEISFTVAPIRKDPTDPNRLINTPRTITAASGGASYDILSKTNPAMGEFIQALRKGTYDLRNLSQAKASTPGFNKIAVGALALTAAGIKVGMMKKAMGVDVGTGKGDFIEDLKDTISGALSHAKIDVSIKDTGGHGGGGAGGHGGGKTH